MNKSFFLTLASNACLNHFTNNTLSKFSNVLPHPISDKNNIRLFVRLRSIIISTTLTNPNLQTNYININIGELEPKPINDIYDKCLGRIEFPPKRVCGKYGIHEFEYSSFHPLRTLPLHQLSVLITDCDGNQLQLAYGSSTFVTLEISEMDLSNQFTVTCLSNDRRAQNYYVNNTYTDFRCALPHEIMLDNWEVALSSVIYPKQLKGRVLVRWKVEWVNPNSQGSKDTLEIAIDIMQHDTVEEFVQTFKSLLEADSVWKEKIKLKINSSGRYLFEYQEHKMGSGHAIMQFGETFSKVLGDKSRHEDFTGRSGTTTFEALPNIDASKPSTIGLVYCDIVESSAVGGSLYPLIHIMPLENYAKTSNTKKTSIYEPHHLIFHPLINRPFSSIRFQIVQPDGSPHDFGIRKTTDPGLAITLIFRPINSPNAHSRVIKCSPFSPC